MELALTHRFRTGQDYKGIPIHAADGVHAYALNLAQQHIPAGARVLDVGSGSGALAERLSDAGYDVTATDIDLRGFRAAVKSTVWDANSEALPVEEGSLDAVFAIEIIEHTENPLAALRNFRRLLKPGGTLIVSTPHVCHPRSRLKFLLSGSPSYFGPGEYRGSGHRALIPDWMLRLHLDATGYKLTQVAYAGNMSMSTINRALFPLLSLFGRTFLNAPRVDEGDGACVFCVAHV